MSNNQLKVISVQNISHNYEEHKALNNISFDVEKGEIFGMLGPDGAGKTTLIRILTTLILPSEGKAQVAGWDIFDDFKKIRSNIGYMPGRFSLYEDLSVEENLKLFASIFGTTIEENYHLIGDIYSQIEPYKSRKAGKLSGGMKQKLALSCAMIHAPDVIFLDEPTTGVDPVSRKEFWQMLHKLKREGITILVSTPYMDEASQCDRVGLLFKGNLMQIDTPDSIVNRFEYPLYEIRTEQKQNLATDLREINSVHSAYLSGENIHFTMEKDRGETDDIKKELSTKGHRQIYLQKVQPTIEDCFLELMKDE